MKIILCGGGTGGHITPILAVAHELKKQSPDTKIVFVTERGGKFSHLIKNHTSIDSIETIYAGKFRRYYGESWAKRLTDIKTIVLNIRDFFLVIIGFFQSLKLIRREKPDVIFLKGSYEGLPMGLAAKLLHRSYVTHDSDSSPSLTNRIVGRWAKYNATGIRTGNYPYPKDKVRYVGVPVGPEYEYVTPELQAQYKEAINIPKKAKMLFVTGGSLGASNVNLTVDKILKKLITDWPELYVVLQAGKGKMANFSEQVNSDQVILQEFVPNMYKYSGAADLVVTRGGANSIAELAIQAKPCILIPSPSLAAGHQLKNGETLQKDNAVELIDERHLLKNPQILLVAIDKLLKDDNKRKKLSENIESFGQPSAAHEIAAMLISAAS